MSKVSIKRETMLNLITSHIARDTTETIDRKTLIIVVNFKDRSDRLYSLLILVEPSEKVKRGR